MKTPSQPRAIYYIVAIQIWEYFSFTACVPCLSSISPISSALMTADAISSVQRFTPLAYVTLFSAAGLPTACRQPHGGDCSARC